MYLSDGIFAIYEIEKSNSYSEDKSSLLQFIKPDDQEYILKSFAECLETRQGFTYVFQIETANHHQKYIEINTYAQLDNEPGKHRLYGTIQDISEKYKNEQALKNSESKYKSLFKLSPLPKLVLDVEKFKIKDVNASLVQLMNTEEKALIHSEFSSLLKLKAKDKNEFLGKIKTFKSTSENRSYLGKTKLLIKDEKVAFVEIYAHQLNFEEEEHIVLTFLMFLKMNNTKKIQSLEQNLLKSAYQSTANLDHILRTFLLGLEKQIPGLHTSILWVNNNMLYNYISPSIPDEIVSFIDGHETGPKMGSCGAAVFKKKSIIVEDIRKDEKWEKFSDMFVQGGYLASWSHPIFNDEGEVIANFANYYNIVKKPTTFELKRFQRLASVLGLVLNNAAKTKALNLSLERYQNVTKATYDAIWEYDVERGSVTLQFMSMFSRLPFCYTSIG